MGYFSPNKINIYDNKPILTKFELLPTRQILAITKERLETLKTMANDIKTMLVVKRQSYFNANHSLYDYFAVAIQLLNNIKGNVLTNVFTYSFESKEEIALIIMMICDSDLKYLEEYKKVYEFSGNIEVARARMQTIFGFYSPKLHAIELHYAALLNKLEKNQDIKLSRIKSEEDKND